MSDHWLAKRCLKTSLFLPVNTFQTAKPDATGIKTLGYERLDNKIEKWNEFYEIIKWSYTITIILIPQIILNDLGLKFKGVWDSLAGMLTRTDSHALGIPCRFLLKGEMQKIRLLMNWHAKMWHTHEKTKLLYF